MASSNQIPTGDNAWTSEEEVILTRCWISVYEGALCSGPPDNPIGFDYQKLAHLFNSHMRRSHRRLHTAVFIKWVDMAANLRKFYNSYNRALISQGRWGGDDDHMTMLAQTVYCELYDTCFLHEDVWELLTKRNYFNV